MAAALALENEAEGALLEAMTLAIGTRQQQSQLCQPAVKWESVAPGAASTTSVHDRSWAAEAVAGLLVLQGSSLIAGMRAIRQISITVRK